MPKPLVDGIKQRNSNFAESFFIILLSLCSPTDTYYHGADESCGFESNARLQFVSAAFYYNRDLTEKHGNALPPGHMLRLQEHTYFQHFAHTNDQSDFSIHFPCRDTYRGLKSVEAVKVQIPMLASTTMTEILSIEKENSMQMSS